MFCPICGAQCDDNAQQCMTCGHVFNAQPQQSGYQPMYQPPVPQVGMKWYKFLIYFALWAGGILNALNGINMITGNVYGELKDVTYAIFDGLKPVDLIFGVLLIVVAAFQIYTRFQLAAFKKQAPKMVVLAYAAVMIVGLAYNIVVSAVIGVDFNVASFVLTVALNAALLFANMTYFKKREFLFVNN